MPRAALLSNRPFRLAGPVHGALAIAWLLASKVPAMVAEFLARGATKVYAAGTNEAGLAELKVSLGEKVVARVLDVADWDAVHAYATANATF